MSNSSFPGYPSYTFFPGYSNGSGLSGSINSGEERPENPKEGEMFFDIRYNKPIYYNGLDWVDSEGNSDIKIAPRTDAGYIIFKDYNILVIPIVSQNHIIGFLVPYGNNNCVISYDPWNDIFYEGDLLLLDFSIESENLLIYSNIMEYITSLFDMQFINSGDPNIQWMTMPIDEIVPNTLGNENWRELFAERYGESYKLFIIADNIPESRIIATDETNFPLMEIARSGGWVEPTATIMTQTDAEALTELKKKIILTNGHITENVTVEEQTFTFNVWYDQNNEKYYDLTQVAGANVPSNIVLLIDSHLQLQIIGTKSSDNEVATASVPMDFTSLVNFDEFKYFTNVTTIDERAFYNCSNLTSITIPNSITAIQLNAFDGCSNLKSIAIPDSVTTLGNAAFNRCRFDTMIFGNGISSIRNLGELIVDSVTIRAITPPELPNSFPFRSVHNIYVPSDSINAYKTANVWSSYANIIKAINTFASPILTY